MEINEEKIKNTDISFLKKYYNIPDNHYLFSKESKEHYKLLTYMSKQFDDIIILDVGTHEGFSCLSLSQNPKNKVITYDVPNNFYPKVSDLPFLNDYPNVTRKIMDINQETDEVLNSATIIFFDALHDGVMEKIFTDRLEKINFKGFLICDDVFSVYHPKCNEWFSGLEIEKYDLTYVGHNTGTGLVNYYKDKSVKLV